MKLFALLILTALAHVAHADADADLSSFATAAQEFAAGRAPTEAELTSTLWMTTSFAADSTVKGPASANYPTGRIPSAAGDYRQIGRFTTSVDAQKVLNVTAALTSTDAERGVLINEMDFVGTVDASSLTLVSLGSPAVCAMRTLCRHLRSGKLLCAQASEDERPTCVAQFKKSDIIAYLGFSPVHP